MSDFRLLTMLDRLAGGLQLYVENYDIKAHAKKAGSKLKPSYPVDYKISDSIMQALSESEDWVIEVGQTKEYSELPGYLQKLIRQYMPRFFKQYPRYKDMAYFKGVK